MTQPIVSNTPHAAALQRIEVEKRKRGHSDEKPLSSDDLRAAHRAAEVSFWNDWYKTGPNAAERHDAYSQAAILCSDLYFAPFIRRDKTVE
jgi:hypothetical protein